MNSKTKTIISLAAFLVLAFISGIAASSFYIGDRNLIVTVGTIVLVGASLYSAFRNPTWIKTLVIITGLVAGFVCSIKGIC